MFMLAAFSVNLLGPAITSAQEEGPATVCVLQMAATGDVMAIIVDDSRDIDIAVVVPRDNVTNLPIRCMDLDRLGVAVANQESFQVTVRTNIYTNKGELKCSKGPFNLNANGGRGVNFQDCL
jgi:hypothetical protein